MRRLLKNKLMKNNIKRIIAMILVLILTLTGVNLGPIMKANAATQYKTLYFIDNTAQQWVKNDSAVMELVDNTNGHDSYWMTQKDEVTWYVNVPESAYNITFNRYSSDKTVKWNSWSAGGRDENNVYYADGSEYGHWEVIKESKNCFHTGDIIYLDVSEFTEWKESNAIIYANFSDASKEENGGKNIDLSSADKKKYDPKRINFEVNENVYAYVVTSEDSGADVLRFWRGNADTLWNCSVKLTYEEYKAGKNYVKVTGWNDSGLTYEGDDIIDFENDTDEDGLTDYCEIVLNCDISNVDSDGDGLTDGQEVYLTGTHPAVYDSLVQGVSDAEADTDQDGLNNAQELDLGTDPCNKDTDEDGVADGVEVNQITSNPLVADTDGDTLNDGDDLALGFSPLLQDTDSDGILDCDERVQQTLNVVIENEERPEVSSVSVSFEGTGNINSTTYIEDLYGTDAYVSETVGLVGVPVEIKSTSKFDTATISFFMNPDIINVEEMENLLVLWYDEENDMFVAQETVVDITNMSVSANVPHFSKYMIVDKTEWYDAWRDRIDYTEGSQCGYDTVIAIDCSSSMRDNDAFFTYTYRDTLYPGSTYNVWTCYRKLAAENYIHTQKENDQTAVVLFANYFCIACPLTDSRLEAIGALDLVNSMGGTNIDCAIRASVDVLSKSERDNEKMVLLLSDGESEVDNATIDLAVSNGIKINTVYIGYDSDSSLLQKIAKKTEGEYYKASTAEQLVNVCNEIALRQKIDFTDRDKDGLPDVYEIRGMKVSNNRVLYSDPGNPDTDGDGILDGKEVSAMPMFHIIKAFDAAGVPCNIDAYVFTMYSDPKNPDTDDDGIMDGEDNRPKIKGIYSEEVGEVVTGELTIVSCTNRFGHAFLVYQSFIKVDSLDFRGLSGGFEYMSWEKLEPCRYVIGMNEYVTIGSSSVVLGDFKEAIEYPWESHDGDDAGIFFNREFAEAKFDYDIKYNENHPEKYKPMYSKNKAYSRLITKRQLAEVINFCSQVDYYNLNINNCTSVAMGAWNRAFDKTEFLCVPPIPALLKAQIEKKQDSFVFDLYDIMGLETEGN